MTTTRRKPRGAPISHAPAKPSSLRVWVADPINQVCHPRTDHNLNLLKRSARRRETGEVGDPGTEKDRNEIDPNLSEKPKLQALPSNGGPRDPNGPIPGGNSQLNGVSDIRNEREGRQNRGRPGRRRTMSDDEGGTPTRRTTTPPPCVVENPPPADESTAANRVHKGPKIRSTRRRNPERHRIPDHRDLDVTSGVPVEQRPDRIVGPRDEPVQRHAETRDDARHLSPPVPCRAARTTR